MPPAGLRPLRHRTFALTWTAAAASDMGTWVQLATIGALVASASGSALATAMVAAATFAPQGVCSPLGGVLADRVDRRRLFLATLAGQTVITAVIAGVLFAGIRHPGVLSVLVLAQSGAGALGAPALQAVLPDLVPRAELTAAVALGNLGWNTGRVLGPLVAALLVPVGAGYAIAANAASFAILWLAMLSVRRPFPPASRDRSRIHSELRDGARALRRTPSVAITVATLVVLHFCYIPFMGLVPATARALLERTGARVDEPALAGAASRLMSAQGIGAIVGALALASLLERFRRSSVITAALFGIAVLLPLHALVPQLAVAALAIAALGACSAVAFSSFIGVVQRDAPAEHRGRILSWQQGTMGLSYGIALAVHGAAADRFGLPALFGAGALATLAVLAVARRSGTWAARVDGRSLPDDPPRQPVAAATA